MDDEAAHYRGGFTEEQIDRLLEQMDRDYVAWANGFASLMSDETANPLFANIFTKNLMNLRPDVTRLALEAAFKSDHRTDVARSAARMHILQSENDPAVPVAVGQWLVEHTRSDPLDRVTARGHFPHITDPEPVTKSILAFLEHAHEDG